jgi:hypothetical protein
VKYEKPTVETRRALKALLKPTISPTADGTDV